MGDTEVIGPPTREATADYLTEVARAAEDAGFVFALVPVGTTCEDAWLASAVVAARTEKLKFLVAMRPGFVAPTVAAKMSNTLDQMTRGRVLINVVTGGFPAELAADGDFTEHDERYARTQEFMQVVRQGVDGAETWSHEGRYYRIENGDVHPEAVPAAVARRSTSAAHRRRRRRSARRRPTSTCSGASRCRWCASASPTCARARRSSGGRCGSACASTSCVRETDAEARAAAEALVAEIPENFQKMMDKHHAAGDSEGEKRQRALASSRR